MLAWALVCILPLAAAFDWDEPTALDFYVQSDDGYFQWTELDMYEYQGVDVYIINMTSQKWMDESFTSRSVWWHWMGIAIPHDVEVDDIGFLGIVGGDNDDPEAYPQENDPNNLLLAWIANNTKVVTAYMLQVPNQPHVFVNDPDQDRKSEDNWIAWTWVEAMRLNGSIPEMVARFPMTKAAKRGLDTINEFTLAKTGSNITRFIAGGASKRGWTTWSLAAMDQRVVGITPLVFSLFNMAEVLMHHYRAMDGGWSFAFTPYWNVNLTYYILDPLIDVLYDYEDMYRYRERLTMPKLIISATGDEFFFLSDSHYWWDDMPGENRFMMCANAQHILFPHWLEIVRNLVVFVKALIRDVPMPQVTWERIQEDGGGRVIMTTDTEPLEVRGYRGETLNNHTSESFFYFHYIPYNRQDYVTDPSVTVSLFGYITVHGLSQQRGILQCPNELQVKRDFRLFVEGDDGAEGQPVRFTREEVTEIPVDDGFQYEIYDDEVDSIWVGQFIQADFEGLDDFDFRFTTEVNVIPDTFPREECTSGAECYGYIV